MHDYPAFLLKELADGPLSAELVKKDARAAGVSERTLKRAKRALGVGSDKEGDGTWSWLPPHESVEGGTSRPSSGRALIPLGSVRAAVFGASGGETPPQPAEG